MFDLIARRLGLGRRRHLRLDELGVAAGGARLIFIQRAEVYATRKFDNLVGDAREILRGRDCACILGSAANIRRADSPITILRMVGGSNVRC